MCRGGEIGDRNDNQKRKGEGADEVQRKRKAYRKVVATLFVSLSLIHVIGIT